MGLSFRKSIQVLPGVKVNLSKSGVSLSTGIPGLHASINSKGQVRGTASLPGTGLRYTKSKNIKDFIPGMADEKKTSKRAEKNEKHAKEVQEETKEAPKKADLAKEIMKLYAVSDKRVDWLAIKNSTADHPLKIYAANVIDGDITTYLDVIQAVNPFDEFISLGSEFKCSSDNPMNIEIDCELNSETVFEEYKDNKDLKEDYASAIAIKLARDLFALLPIWNVSVNENDNNANILNVTFSRDQFEELNFSRIDASDTVRKFGGEINL